MTKVYINYEAFQLIEQRKTITPDELAKAIGVKASSAASWLSKWAKRDYLEYVPFVGPMPERRRGPGRPKGARGHYKIGKKWWGALVYESERIDTEIRQ